jgi:hypothetical protein
MYSQIKIVDNINNEVSPLQIRCNILISGKIIKEIPGSVGSGTHAIITRQQSRREYCVWHFQIIPWQFWSPLRRDGVYNVLQQNSLVSFLGHVDFRVKTYVLPLGYVYFAPNFDGGVL